MHDTGVKKMLRTYTRASDRSRKKKSNFAGFLGPKLAEKLADFTEISREFSGQTSPKSNWYLKNGRFCGYFQGKFREKSIGFALIRPAFLTFF